MNVYEKLMEVQSELKAPKNQFNKFGGYNYRSCEDILEGTKPLLADVKAVITITDNIEIIGDRIYVKATATFVDIEKVEKIEVSAFARESESKKGMDPSQVTGSTSSYARKYALNGLLCIDDTKDADGYKNGNKDTTTKGVTAKDITKGTITKGKATEHTLTDKQLKRLYAIAKGAGFSVTDIKHHIKVKFNIDHLHDLSRVQYDKMCDGYEKMKKGGVK